MAEIFMLNTGQRKTIKSGFLKTSMVDMVYCGMPDENTFSIGMLLSNGYQGHGLNIFFSKKSTSIMLDKHKYYVLNVTPENITLQLSD
ncbi:hypothetical protein [Methanolobus sp. WCC5]|jgi:hypothetical protein|uniref:hypothetical protein n=1 Tax=Methanolobus sp. WCC5 TaxID=3125785 RepID=UPI0032443F7F